MSSVAARARALAAQAVARVRRGESLDRVLEERFAALPADLLRERALIQEMVYGALRWHFQLVPLIHSMLEKPLVDSDSDLESLLQIGLYQLLYMRAAPHAAVNETVNASEEIGLGRARGLVNAVLRRAQRETESLHRRIEADEHLAFAAPEWLLHRLRAAYPQDWRRVAEACNTRAPLTLRVHVGRTTRRACVATLAAAGHGVHEMEGLDQALVLEVPTTVETLPGFTAGEWSVQDAAAQLAEPLLDVRPGQRVLDACAAPGGKAAHILERTPTAELLALEIDPQRLALIRENFTRLGLHGQVVVGDAARPADWWDGQLFDRILLDAPCSATGVIRRHPDIRLHRTPRDLGRLTALQARLLDQLWPLLAPEGKLLYVTCSILPEENRETIAAFLARQPEARCLSWTHPALVRHARFSDPGYQILPGTAGMDGFYFAGLEKTGVEG